MRARLLWIYKNIPQQTEQPTIVHKLQKTKSVEEDTHTKKKTHNKKKCCFAKNLYTFDYNRNTNTAAESQFKNAI